MYEISWLVILVYIKIIIPDDMSIPLVSA